MIQPFTLPPFTGNTSTQPETPVFQASAYEPETEPHLKYDPDHRFETRIQPFFNDGNLKASSRLTWELDPVSSPYRLGSSLVLETADAADNVHVRQGADGQLSIRVNGRDYLFASHDKHGNAMELLIRTNGGDDKVLIDASVTQAVRIEAGDGDDRVQAGGGSTRLFGGKGNDTLNLCSANGYVEGNEGDDMLIGGTGNNVMYGGPGRDRLYAGAGSKRSYLDGGSGDDHLYAGNGHTVLSGGAGDDVMVGHDRSTFYTGAGRDSIRRNGLGDLVYGKHSDLINPSRGSVFCAVTPKDVGSQAFAVRGSVEFKQRVEDDLELLRSSPQGQAMLAHMDAMARSNGAPVTLIEDIHDEGSHYLFGSQELKQLFNNERAPVIGDDPRWGFMKDGLAGSRADRAVIAYNRAQIAELNGVAYSPIVSLYHEMAHAWNGANGTFIPGFTLEFPRGRSAVIPNSERQAVGLENTGRPFDFDGDPLTEPTTSNPKPLTENTLNEEMGVPLRMTYS